MRCAADFPAMINKFYIMDLQPRNSMVRYLVEKGFTVFMASWKNPDASMEGTTIEDYGNADQWQQAMLYVRSPAVPL